VGDGHCITEEGTVIRAAILLGLLAACGHPLEIGEFGDGGVVVGGPCHMSSDCAAAECCDQICTKLDVDTMNCGACGFACEEGYRCQRGACISLRASPDAGSIDTCTPNGGLCLSTASCPSKTPYAPYQCGSDSICCPPSTGGPCKSDCDCDYSDGMGCDVGRCAVVSRVACCASNVGCSPPSP
jgi:hypothetical protein